jgi:hypothetical protein
MEGFNLEPKSLSPKRAQNRLSSFYRCSRYKFRFRMADRRIFFFGKNQFFIDKKSYFVQNFIKKKLIFRAGNQYFHNYS